MSLHFVTVLGLHFVTGTISQTDSVNGTRMSSQKGLGWSWHSSSSTSFSTYSTTHLSGLEHSFLSTKVQTFSSTCLFWFLTTHLHFSTSSGAQTLVGVILETVLQVVM